MSLSRPSTVAGLLLGWAADQMLGDPGRWHPVAGFGRVAAHLEDRTYHDDRAPGVLHVACLVGGATALGVLIERLGRNRPGLQLLSTAAATWVVLGGRSLDREAAAIHDQLARGDLDQARQQIAHLVGRDPSRLTSEEIARACVESVAENTSDAVVAPLLWGAVGGIPGLLGYRAVNTLDAMIGHRSPRYQQFGWAAARLDDAANWIPARVTGALTAAAAPIVGGAPGVAVRAVLSDAHQHPSPNAGVVEAAFAGALGVQLGGVNVYQGVAEDRGQLGAGRPVAIADIPRVRRLARAVSAMALALSAATAAHFAYHSARRRRRSAQ